MEKVTLKNIIEWTEGEFNNEELLNKANEIFINDISKDTRTIKDGVIYLALSGKVFDGHDFINQAFESGAGFSIASDISKVDDKYKDRIIKVSDTQVALNKISAGYIEKLNIPVVAITGSVGKTTTKEMIASVLSTKYKVLKTKENLNNNFGAPYTALELDSTIDIAVIEGGMNHAGELNSISQAITPSVCVITNIGESHIGNLGSRENIFKAKCEIFNYAKDDATLVLNKDDDFLPSVKGNSNVLKNPDNHKVIYRGLSDIVKEDVNKEEGYVIYETSDGFKFRVNSLVRNIASAALLAYEVGKLYNIDDEDIKRGIENFNNISKRMEVIKLNKVTILSDYYNACFDSIESAIQSLSNFKDETNRTIAILGDVGELGDYSQDIHKKIGTMLNKYSIDKIYFAGCDIKNAYEEYNGVKEYFETKEQLIESLDENIFYKDDVILIKSSNFCKFGDIFDKIKEIDE